MIDSLPQISWKELYCSLYVFPQLLPRIAASMSRGKSKSRPLHQGSQALHDPDWRDNLDRWMIPSVQILPVTGRNAIAKLEQNNAWDPIEYRCSNVFPSIVQLPDDRPLGCVTSPIRVVQAKLRLRLALSGAWRFVNPYGLMTPNAPNMNNLHTWHMWHVDMAEYAPLGAKMMGNLMIGIIADRLEIGWKPARWGSKGPDPMVISGVKSKFFDSQLLFSKNSLNPCTACTYPHKTVG